MAHPIIGSGLCLIYQFDRTLWLFWFHKQCKFWIHQLLPHFSIECTKMFGLTLCSLVSVASGALNIPLRFTVPQWTVGAQRNTLWKILTFISQYMTVKGKTIKFYCFTQYVISISTRSLVLKKKKKEFLTRLFFYLTSLFWGYNDKFGLHDSHGPRLTDGRETDDTSLLQNTLIFSGNYK